MKITDLTIDPKSLGNKLWLVDVTPAYEYKDNHRTDTITGYRYVVAMPEKGLDKINVKIDGKQLMEAPDGFSEVRFEGLEVFIYWSQGQPQVACYTKVYITSNMPLEKQYHAVQWDRPETWRAFLRRIHTVIEYLPDGSTTIKKKGGFPYDPNR